MVFLDPRPKLLLRLRVLRLLKEAAHQGGKGAVLEHDGAISQPLFAPLRQFDHLQLRDGGKLALGLGAELPLVIPVITEADRDNAPASRAKIRAKASVVLELSPCIPPTSPVVRPARARSASPVSQK